MRYKEGGSQFRPWDMSATNVILRIAENSACALSFTSAWYHMILLHDTTVDTLAYGSCYHSISCSPIHVSITWFLLLKYDWYFTYKKKLMLGEINGNINNWLSHLILKEFNFCFTRSSHTNINLVPKFYILFQLLTSYIHFNLCSTNTVHCNFHNFESGSNSLIF